MSVGVTCLTGTDGDTQLMCGRHTVISIGVPLISRILSIFYAFISWCLNYLLMPLPTLPIQVCSNYINRSCRLTHLPPPWYQRRILLFSSSHACAFGHLNG